MNFRQVRKKIKTVQNVKKITNAMQMVSAVKMRKAQRQALEGREYRQMLDRILKRIVTKASDIKDVNIPWMHQPEGNRTLYILVTSNKGLCGSFHTYLFKHLLDNVKPEKSDFICVGQKGAEFVTRLGSKVVADFSSQQPFADGISSIFSVIEEKYLSGGYGNVVLIYNQFISSFKNVPTLEPLLPIVELTALAEEETTKQVADSSAIPTDYLIEPSVDELLRPLIEDYIREKLRSAISDSEAAEHSARMMAMKNATDNAGEVIYSLTLLRNKIRQSQITGELLDMIAAKESSSTP